jgi:cobyric acid synthase
MVITVQLCRISNFKYLEIFRKYPDVRCRSVSTETSKIRRSRPECKLLGKVKVYLCVP